MNFFVKIVAFDKLVSSKFKSLLIVLKKEPIYDTVRNINNSNNNNNIASHVCVFEF